jgi:hypothetical protein
MPPVPEESTPPSTLEPLTITEAFHLSKYAADGSLIETLHYRTGDSCVMRELADGSKQQVPLLEIAD